MYNVCLRNRLHCFLHIYIDVTCHFRHFILPLQKEQVCAKRARVSLLFHLYDTFIQ